MRPRQSDGRALKRFDLGAVRTNFPDYDESLSTACEISVTCPNRVTYRRIRSRSLSWPAIAHHLVRSSMPSQRSLVSASQTTVQRIGYAVGTAAAGIAANVSGLSEGTNNAAAKAAGFSVFAGFTPILCLAVLSSWEFTTAPPANISRLQPVDQHESVTEPN
jgi:hypothetical protein